MNRRMLRPQALISRVLALLLLLVAGSGRADVAHEYSEVLRRWLATTDEDTAIDELGIAHMRHPQACGIRLAKNPWLSHARYLARSNPQILVPIIDLHTSLCLYELDQRQRSERQIFECLLSESESVLSALTDTYLERVQREQPEQLQEARRIVAGSWARIGNAYRSEGYLEAAATYFSRATQIDSSCVEALHAHAAILEKQWSYREAVVAFDRVIELQPEHYEARLRRARCEARRHRTGRVIEQLARLADGDGPDWVRVLAFEEQILLYSEQGRNEQAQALARRALQQFPGHERLSLLLLHLLDERSEESHALLDHLTRVDRPPTTVTARVLYNEWPDDLNKLLASVLDEVEARAPLLAEALGVDQLAGVDIELDNDLLGDIEP